MSASSQLTPFQLSKVDLVVYHPCSDGFASAVVIKHYLEIHHPQQEVKFLAGVHGAAHPDIEAAFAGKHVLFCDFSYRSQVMRDILRVASSLLIVDHHKTALEDLADLPPEVKHFDMDHSGCALTWMYAFPDLPVPSLIRYIEDVDLWRNSLPRVAEFKAWFYQQPFNFELYHNYLVREDLLETAIASWGEISLKLQQAQVREAVARSAICHHFGEERCLAIAYTNSTCHKSEVGEALLQKYGTCIDLAVVWHYSAADNATYFSLRSDADHIDTGDLAYGLGGGGHRNAAGVVQQGCASQLPLGS